MKRIHVMAWAVSQYEPPPSIFTLRRWARAGLIWPPAKKEGRNWWVVPHARKVDRDDPVLREQWS